MTDPHFPSTDRPTAPSSSEPSVVPDNWPSDTSPEADAPPPTQRGPSGDETDESGQTDEAGT